jgi:hypothetical protein
MHCSPRSLSQRITAHIQLAPAVSGALGQACFQALQTPSNLSPHQV